MSETVLERLTRDAELIGPAVIVAETTDRTLANVRAMVRRQRIAVLQMQDPWRASSYVAVRETPLVFVVAITPSWALGAAAVIRRASAVPMVVAGVTPTPDELLELLDAGANLVIDGGASEREIRSRVVGLYGATGRETNLGTRWLESPGLRMDLYSRTCTVDGQPVQLSRMEYQLLLFLMQRAQQTLQPEEITRRVWQWNDGDGLNTLRIHIGRVRRKLGDNAHSPRFVSSVRGAGYRFVQPVSHLADDDGPSRGENEVLLEARLTGLYETLAAARVGSDLVDLTQRTMDAVVSSNQCDSASLFRHLHDRQRSQLVASAGTSSAWNSAMRRGHSLTQGFVGGQAVEAADIVQIADIRLAARRYPGSARLLAANGLRSCLIVPVVVDGQVWGDIGFARRLPHAFTPQQVVYLRSITELVGLKVASLAS